jgi:hypothetical protein
MRCHQLICLVSLAAALAACAAPTPAQSSTPPTQYAAPPTLADPWDDLFLHTPYPFTAELPPAEVSALDGVYIKQVETGQIAAHCVRCPEYAPYDGLWKLSFDDGIYRIYYDRTSWTGLGSFTISGDALTLFNDPTCPELSSTYHFTLAADGQLVISDLNADPCAIKLRTMNLTQQPWLSCQPPNHEAAISGHWPVPAGCE